MGWWMISLSVEMARQFREPELSVLGMKRRDLVGWARVERNLIIPQDPCTLYEHQENGKEKLTPFFLPSFAGFRLPTEIFFFKRRQRVYLSPFFH